MNEDFVSSAFSIDEQLMIYIYIDNSLASTTWYDNPFVCENTIDRVFLLSRLELNTYFTSCDDKQAAQTDYSAGPGTILYNLPTGEYESYWTRSPSPSFSSVDELPHVSYIDEYDGNYTEGQAKYRRGVRPAMWVVIEDNN